MTALVELCAGTASVSLWALGRCGPLSGFMGSKRRWSHLLVDALDCDRPDRVVLVDAGPWGDVWTVLRDPVQREAVAMWLDGLSALADERQVFAVALSRPFSRAPDGVGAYIVLSALEWRTRPVWWTGVEWTTATGPPLCRSTTRPDRWRVIPPATLAARLRALDRLPWDRVEVVHGDVRSVDPIPGATVLLDPPYLGAPRYACLFPRADVLAVARRWQAAGGRVAVCEAVPLDDLVAAGWHAARLPSVRRGQPEPREWLTTSWPVVVERQLVLARWP